MLSNVLFYSMFSRHGKAQASLALLIWLNENVPFHSMFSRHGKAQASLALLIWLNENVLLVLPLFVINALLFPSFLFAPYASKLFVMCFLLFCNTYYLHIFSSNRTFAPYCPSMGLDKGILSSCIKS